MPSLRQTIYRSRDVEVDVTQRAVRAGGETQHPRARTFDVLCYLIEHRERVVTHEELLSEFWPGISVSSNTLRQCVNEARKLLNDDSRDPKFIRTLAKAGYQFVGPVEEVESGFLEEVTSIEIEYEEESSELAGALPAPRASQVNLFFAAVAIVVTVALAVWLWQASGAKAVAESVIVLPFENSSGANDLDWLREGLEDMLITNLGRSAGMHVLGREQVRGLLAAGDASGAFDRAIAWGRQHGAGIVITGSFGRLGDQVRVVAQAYRVRDGILIRPEGFTAERPEQILSRIDLASLNLAAALGRPVAQQDRQVGLSSLMTPSLEAYRNYSLGLEKADGLEAAEAIELFRKATELDPDFAMAHARIGYTYAMSWGRPVEAKPSLEKAFRLSGRLTQSDRLHIAAWYAMANLDYPGAIRAFQSIIANNPRDIEAYTRLGSLLSGEKRVAEAVNVLEQALTLDPNSASTWNTLSGVHYRVGQGEQAVVAARRYVALSATEPNSWDTLGLALHVAGKMAEAEQAYQRALAIKPGFGIAIIHLANLAYQMGRYQEAEKYCRQYIEGSQSGRDKGRGYSTLASILLRRNRSS